MAEKENGRLSADAQDWVKSSDNTLNRLIRKTAEAAGEPEPSLEELNKLKDNAESEGTR